MYVCWKTITMWLTLQYIVKESTLRISHDNSFVFHATFRSFTVNKSSTGVASHIPIGSHPTKKESKIHEEDKWRLEIVHLQSKRAFAMHMRKRAQEFEAMLQPYGAPPRRSVCGCFFGNNVLGVDRFGDSGIVKCW